jgi:glycosyltransferase involved in cell wall biosynthesis
MKILIITMNVGKTAPGIVFEKLIHGLSSFHQVDLLAADYNPSINLSYVQNIIISKKYNIHPRISRFLISLFNVNPFDCLWAWNLKKLINNKTNNKYDIILSFLSFDHYAAIIAGTYLSKKYGIKLAFHSTDAIPAPIGWLEDDMFYRSLRKMMAKYLHNADAFFTTNDHMLNYQLKTFKPKEHLITNVIYNPGLDKFNDFPKPDTITNNFVYTGGIYGPRKAEYLMAGFEKLLEIYPDSKLIFVGSHLSSLSLLGLKAETLKKIDVVPFTGDLNPYYSCATALIDIDGDIDNDVFISSKMPRYLMINRLIISETGINSPSHHLFKGIDSIIQCEHNADQLCLAMEKTIEMKDAVSFDDRNSVVQLFEIKNIINQMTLSLNRMITL